MLYRRKKDHGRAEALLLAAWVLGVRYSAKQGMHIAGAAEELREEGFSAEQEETEMDDGLPEEHASDAARDLAH